MDRIEQFKATYKSQRKLHWMSALALAVLALTTSVAMAQTPDAALPGKGIKVQALQSSLAEETFQTMLVDRALEKLGYEPQPIKEVEYPTAHIAIANGDATFLAVHWDPLHKDYYNNAGGDAKLLRVGEYAGPAAQGYLIDKATAERYNITNIEQLRDPGLAKLFDHDGDGKADLTGCTPGWGCEAMIENHMDAYKLRATVRHVQGSYAALMADTIGRYKRGESVLYYTWTPYWVSGVMVPGKDVVWLQVPFSSNPDQANTRLNDGSDYGFAVNTTRIVVNRAWAEKNPAAVKLFEVMRLPIADINAQNERMRDGENTQADIVRHTDGWIKFHQQLFDSWIAQAQAAAKLP
ncbi:MULTISPECIES: glycine betaine/L-proline ABC transporter substrate-binding protein ProX [unclassified Duganella]|uniref:glycine betaine/L-proline ABC transporter substrate-binding protein ProX n=1 Tax=unclassified Duganella TaxID=2636909 RepID=UPI00088CDFB8|nr:MULTISPECIES: glycine betaine/L-proline ABC transporter substrate-binding protein ProX [unclassified Duganella]SDF73669.1 glycine betaine/proline transport system substrate-binding protein [Duganella sp. OV458]SDI55798.1 glycine betaine/proline transport system substrate-binding protein [Duganella sp. OV510]